VFYSVSYSQVYTWVKKYLADGEAGLADRRGHHKTDEEVDELERLRRENLRLKRQLEERDMLVELLKKVKEFEGR
jgi:transposase